MLSPKESKLLNERAIPLYLVWVSLFSTILVLLLLSSFVFHNQEGRDVSSPIIFVLYVGGGCFCAASILLSRLFLDKIVLQQLEKAIKNIPSQNDEAEGIGVDEDSFEYSLVDTSIDSYSKMLRVLFFGHGFFAVTGFVIASQTKNVLVSLPLFIPFMLAHCLCFPRVKRVIELTEATIFKVREKL